MVEELTFAKDEFGFIANSKKSQAAAMYRAGATSLDVASALGHSHLNVITELEAEGYQITRKKVLTKGHWVTKYTIGEWHDSASED